MSEDEENRDNGWLEHWLTVGRVSKDAESELEEVYAKVVKMGNSMVALTAVCLLYSNPEDDETGFTVSQKGETLRVNVYTPDSHAELVIYSVEGETDIIQASVTDTRLVTLGEWFKVVDEERQAHTEK